MNLFKLRGELPKTTSTIIAASGFVVLLSIWAIITQFGIISDALLPSPFAVLKAVPELHFENALVINMFQSIKLNVLGYLEAVAICLPVGFVIGLFPFFREMFKKYLDAIRFIPLTAVTGLFIAWPGTAFSVRCISARFPLDPGRGGLCRFYIFSY